MTVLEQLRQTLPTTMRELDNWGFVAHQNNRGGIYFTHPHVDQSVGLSKAMMIVEHLKNDFDICA